MRPHDLCSSPLNQGFATGSSLSVPLVDQESADLPNPRSKSISVHNVEPFGPDLGASGHNADADQLVVAIRGVVAS